MTPAERDALVKRLRQLRATMPDVYADDLWPEDALSALSDAIAALTAQPSAAEPVADEGNTVADCGDKLPCCEYGCTDAVYWNPYNQVVQCHNCGHVYHPAPSPESRDEVRVPRPDAACAAGKKSITLTYFDGDKRETVLAMLAAEPVAQREGQ